MAKQLTGETVEPKILTVDREGEWSSLVGKALKGAGLRVEAVTTMDKAIAAMSQEDTEITTVITEGLNGKWPQLAQAAVEAGIMPVVVTRSSLSLSSAEEMGVPVFVKNDLEKSEQTVLRLVKTVAPQPEGRPS